MGFIAAIHLVHDELPLVPTIEHCSDVTLRYEYGTTTGEQHLQFVSAFGAEKEVFEAAMTADPTVSNTMCVATFENRTVYRVTIETGLEIVPARCAEDGVFTFRIMSAEGGWLARVHLPDRDALSAFRYRARDQGISFRVNNLYDSSVSDEQTYFLTDRQHEILIMAYYAGYFDVPRRATQDDLACRLDISDSAVSQRIRRAVSELIASTLENDRAPDERG